MVTHNPSSWDDMTEELPRIRGPVGYGVSHQQKMEKKFENKIGFSGSLNAFAKGFITQSSPIASHRTTVTHRENTLPVLLVSLGGYILNDHVKILQRVISCMSHM